jgi:hypothetical protein
MGRKKARVRKVAISITIDDKVYNYCVKQSLKRGLSLSAYINQLVRNEMACCPGELDELKLWEGVLERYISEGKCGEEVDRIKKNIERIKGERNERK